MKFYFLQVINVYNELIQTGGIQSTAEGNNVFIDIRGNLTGDVLVFIGPKKNNFSGLTNINELIQSDNLLEQQRGVAFNILKQKFNGLAFVPQSIVWLLNLGLTGTFLYFNWESIHKFLCGTYNLQGITSLLPATLLVLATPLLAKFFGFKIMKPVLFIIFRLVKLFRKKQNRNVES